MGAVGILHLGIPGTGASPRAAAWSDPPAVTRPNPQTLADLVQSLFPFGEERVEEAGRLGEGHALPDGDAVPDVSAQLSALLAQLARTPESDVDVSAGWTAGLKAGDEVGRFVLVRELGRGGFGVVFEAVDRELGRAVAFKAIRPGSRIVGRSEEWLRREAEAVARLNHPNIVTLHDFGRGPSGPYLIFELLRGRTLADRLRDGPIPLREAIRIAVDVARVLAHAHAAGVVHRDLKPGNIFLGEDGTLKVLDFGLAFLFGRGGPASAGTPAYMAPEQWRSEPGDERTDLFSLGTLLHQMISGAVPYRVSRDRSEALDPGPPPELPRALAPAPVRQLVSRMLEKEPAGRPASAGTVLNALLAAQRRLEPIARVPRRLLLAGAAALAAAALGLGLWLRQHELPLAPGERVLVAVTDFDNATGDQDLDGLSGLLITSLEQSQRVQVLTRSRLLGLLRQLGKGGAPRIDEAIGRELARAAGARLLLIGSAQRFGAAYALELKALEPSADRYLFSVSERARKKEEIPGALDRLSVDARRALRERADDIKVAQVRLAESVTGNVEAYQQYFAGVDCMDRPSQGASWISNMRCAPYFRQALAIDPTFALAHYQLAYMLTMEQGPVAERDAHMAAALRSIDRVPTKEAGLIRAWKAHLDGDDDAAAAEYGRVLAEFPDDKLTLYLAGELQFHRGEYASAVPYLEKVLALDPTSEWPLDYLVSAYGALRRRPELQGLVARLRAGPPSPASVHAVVRALGWLGDWEQATAFAREAVEAGGGPAAQSDLAAALFAAGDYARYEEAARQRVAAAPGEFNPVLTLAVALAAQGRLAEGLHLLDQFAAGAPAATQDDLQFGRALLVAGGGDAEAVWRESAKALALMPDSVNLLAVVLALRGELARATSLEASLSYPTSREELKALVAWRGGDAAGALSRLAAIEERDPWPNWGLVPSYLVAEVSAATGDARGTLAAVQRYRSLWPRGAWRAWAAPRVTYLAAWAHSRLGETELARAELRLLLDGWARADRSLPLLRDARALAPQIGIAAR